MMTEKYRHIGKNTPRKDAREIVTGRAQYIDDLKLPGMLYGKVLRSPYAHANIKHIDKSKAESLLGVRTILTYCDVPEWEWGMPKHIKVLDSKVRYVGDAVALIAADSLDIAETAVDLISVEYEQLPAVYDIDEATIDVKIPLYTKYPDNTDIDEPIPNTPNILQGIVMGNVEKGFAEADFITEGACGYETFPNPLPPEPPGAIATWETPEQLTVYTPSQSIPLNRFIGIPFIGTSVRAISTQCGGSYGTKNANMTPLGYAAILSRVTGKPVKIFFTKEEHFHAYSLRLGSRVNARVGIKKDGTITAISGEWVINTGSASEAVPLQIAVGCGELQIVLRCANWDLQVSSGVSGDKSWRAVFCRSCPWQLRKQNWIRSNSSRKTL
jgi:CO/xanthine dehydrogenase Mo-binding subunit